MKLLKLLLIFALIMIGLFSRPHSKPPHRSTAQTTKLARTSSPPAPVNQEILKNAEHLTETLRRCQQTAQKNRETR